VAVDCARDHAARVVVILDESGNDGNSLGVFLAERGV
jgi:hypothetical protein